MFPTLGDRCWLGLRWFVQSRWPLRAVVAALIVWYFLAHVSDGLSVYFQYDDMMNLWRSWRISWPRLLWACLWPPTVEYRPTGGLVYRLLFTLFGWDAFPYRVLCYTLMAGNLGLLWHLARRLTGSSEIGVLAAVLYAVHWRFYALYVNNGTLYDVVGFPLFYGTASFYLHVREQGRWFRPWEYGVLYLLWALTINAKEMGAALPIVFGLYELIYHWPGRLDGRWIVRHGAVPVLLLALSYYAVRVKTGEYSYLYLVDEYIPHYDLRTFTRFWREVMQHVLYRPWKAPVLNNFWTWGLIGGLGVASALTRRRGLILAWAMCICCAVPVAFIKWRGLFVMYIPLAGFAIAFAGVLVSWRNAVLRRVFDREVPQSGLTPEAVGSFALALALLWPIHRSQQENVLLPQGGNIEIRNQLVDFRHWPLRPEKGAQWLALQDRTNGETYIPFFMAQMFWGDNTLKFDQAQIHKRWQNPKEWYPYSHVFALEGDKVVVVK